jgi:hypothetical protein
MTMVYIPKSSTCVTAFGIIITVSALVFLVVSLRHDRQCHMAADAERAALRGEIEHAGRERAIIGTEVGKIRQAVGILKARLDRDESMAREAGFDVPELTEVTAGSGKMTVGGGPETGPETED